MFEKFEVFKIIRLGFGYAKASPLFSVYHQPRCYQTTSSHPILNFLKQPIFPKLTPPKILWLKKKDKMIILFQWNFLKKGLNVQNFVVKNHLI